MEKGKCKCGCYVPEPNEFGHTIPYFCDPNREAEKGEYYYLSGCSAWEAYQAYMEGKCLTEEGF